MFKRIKKGAVVLGLALLLTAPAWSMAQAETENTDYSHEANVQFLQDNGIEPEQIAQLDADTIRSITMQAHAYGFTPLQIQQMVQGRLSVASQRVVVANVNPPDFKVTLNGVQMDNAYSQYPLIVHNDITYFPMTYHDCRFLGIETQWTDDSTGLFIETTGVTAAYNPYPAPTKNKDILYAVTPHFPITVNGQAIDNLAEEYPLLTLRDITYFPLTWRFAVDEFGWEYSFDDNNGLIINADNIKLEQSAALPEQAPWRGSEDPTALSTAVAIAGDHIYYEGTQGRIMQASLSDTSRSRMVYQLPLRTHASAPDDYTSPSFFRQDGWTLLYYCPDSNPMGPVYMVRLNADGTTSDLVDSPQFANNPDQLVLNGRVYRRDLRQALCDLDGNDLNPGATLTGMALAGDQQEYLVSCFAETASSRYRVMIFDKDGAVVFKTSDRANPNQITIEGKNLYFYNITTSRLCRGVLP